jgi:hypothetical protein
MAVRGVVDSQLALHPAGGQPDLVTDNDGPCRQPGAHAQQLDRVGIAGTGLRPLLRERGDRSAVALGREQRLGDRLVMPASPHACEEKAWIGRITHPRA